MYKTVSVFFDYVLAFALSGLVCKLKGERNTSLFVLVYAMVLLWPTHILNSAVWAQCDSIYVSFIVFALCFLYKKSYRSTFILMGLAFSFKLQTVFIFPFLVYYFFSQRKFHISYFLLIILTDYIVCMPGFLFGRSFLEPFQIYFSQAETYPSMWLNFPSFWRVIGNDNYDLLGIVAILFTGLILILGLIFILVKRICLEQRENYLLVSIWTVWTCLIFLPAMHERYGFLLDILFLVLFWVNPKYMFFTVIPMVTSVVTYAHYLLGTGSYLRGLAVLYLVSYIGYTGKMIFDMTQKQRRG